MRSRHTKVQILTENPLILGFYVNHSERMCLAAVQVNGMALEFAKRKSLKVRMAAIKQNPYAIKFISNPTDEEQLTAVRINANTLSVISNPSYHVCLNACSNFGGIITEVPYHLIDQNMIDVAWGSSSWAIAAMPRPSKQICREAVTRTPRTLSVIADEFKTEELEDIALSHDGECIQWVRVQTKEKRLKAIETTPLSIYLLDKPTYQEKLLAASKHGLVIANLEGLTKDIASAAVKNCELAALYSPWHDYTNPHTGEFKPASIS